MNPTAQLRKAKLGEAKRLAQGHPAGQFVQNSDAEAPSGAVTPRSPESGRWSCSLFDPQSPSFWREPAQRLA